MPADRRSYRIGGFSIAIVLGISGIPMSACGVAPVPTKNETILKRIGHESSAPLETKELIDDVAQNLHQLGNWHLLLGGILIRESPEGLSPEERALHQRGRELGEKIYEAGAVAFPIVALGSTPGEQRQTYRALQSSLESLREEMNAWVLDYLNLRGYDGDSASVSAFSRPLPTLLAE